jgi:DnaJ family protein B protein 12
MNKDDAEKCLKLAREAAEDGDVSIALKWARKACRLHETAESRMLLENLSVQNLQTTSNLSVSGVSCSKSKATDRTTTPRRFTSRTTSASSATATSAEVGLDGADQISESEERNGKNSQCDSGDGGMSSPAATSDPGAASAPEPEQDRASRENEPQAPSSTRRRKSHSERSSGTREEIAAILEARDLYRVLSVDREAREDELRRAYRRLALRFHPDKNNEPGADAAFKRIAHAFQILSNPERRRIYDQTGIDDEQTAERHRRARTRAAHTADMFYMGDAFSAFHGMSNAHIFAGDPFGSMFFGPQELSAEELFEAFFFGGLGSRGPMASAARRRAEFISRQMQRRRGATQPGTSASGPSFRGSFLWQFFPLVLFLLLPYILSVFAPMPPFQLDAQGPFHSQRRTAKTNLPYFVRASTLENHRTRLDELERMVEREWLHRYADSCRAERQHRERLMTFARRAWTHRSRSEYERAAAAVSMDACKAYETLRLQLLDRKVGSSVNSDQSTSAEQNGASST